MLSGKKTTNTQEKKANEIQTKLNFSAANLTTNKSSRKLPLKRPCSSLSPPNTEKQSKKINMASTENVSQSDSQTDTNIPDVLQEIIKEVRDMKESVHTDYDKLKTMITSQQVVITKLEETITTNQHEMAQSLMEKIDYNSSKLLEVAKKKQTTKKRELCIEKQN